MKVIANGIDLDVFKPTPSDFKEKNGLEGKKIILGVASSWDERKGLNDFVELSKRIDDEYKIVLVGLSEQQKNKLPANILKITRTNNVRELAEIYTASDIFFNPTYEDTYPTVNLEAQACETPVVTYRTGGSVESVPEENIVEQGNLKKAISKFESALEIARNVALDKHVLMEKYLKVYGL
jgi:glycosyltransferase involved in cell wall biosynthesis